jgi:hypothetical protein
MTRRSGGKSAHNRHQAMTLLPRLAARTPPQAPETITTRKTRNTGFTYSGMVFLPLAFAVNRQLPIIIIFSQKAENTKNNGGILINAVSHSAGLRRCPTKYIDGWKNDWIGIYLISIKKGVPGNDRYYQEKFSGGEGG